MSNLIYIGPPGVGKGTIARLLVAESGWPHISTGDIFRKAYAVGTEFGIKAHDEFWGPEAGSHLVPDELTNPLAIERIQQPDCANGFQYDGYPRTSGQAATLEEALERIGEKIDHVLYLTATEEELIKRIAGRESCSSCGAIYGVAVPPLRIGYCDNDKTSLTRRADDSIDSALKRIREQWVQSLPVVEFYREKGLIREIDGNQPVTKVLEDIRKIVL